MSTKKKKCGPPDHITGTKYDFLAGYSDAFQLALDSKKMTKFYGLITLKFIQKFGNNMETIWKNTDEDLPEIEQQEALTVEEAAKKSENFNKIRKVSIIWHSR